MMGGEWAQLGGLCIVLLVMSAWPSTGPRTSISSSQKTLFDPVTAHYDAFDQSSATLKLVQVVFRHGARTPLNTIYTFQGANWTHCQDHYKGVEVALLDENGAPQPPAILDPDNPVLPGGCREGTLTEAGYGMALNLGSWLRNRYVAGGSGRGPTHGFLPDLGPGDLPHAGVAAAAGTAGAVAGVAGNASRSRSRSLLSAGWDGTAAEVEPDVAAAAAGAEGAEADALQLLRGWDVSIASLRTTPIRRTVATLRGVLTGLWPRLAHAEGRGRPPVLPVAASVAAREIMYGNDATCGRLVPLHAAMQRDMDAADARDAELPRLNRRVAEALGLDPAQNINWTKLYDVLAASIADGLPLPPGASREILDIIWAQAERHEAAIIGPSPDICASLGPGGAAGSGPAADGDGGADDSSSARARRCHETLRLGIGLLVRRLLDNMESTVADAAAAAAAEPAAAEAPRSRLYLFSGHDSSVTPLLAVLGQPARAWPPFTANVVFELWEAPAPAAAGGSRGAAAAARRAVTAAMTSSALGGRRGLAGRRRLPEDEGEGDVGADALGRGQAEQQQQQQQQQGGGAGRASLGGVWSAAVVASAASASAPATGSGSASGAASKSTLGSGFGSGSGSARPNRKEYWVRILYNGEPLVVPSLSNAGGWAPLGPLRQQVMLPFAINPEEHERACGVADISDLNDPAPPPMVEKKERQMRHALL